MGDFAESGVPFRSLSHNTRPLDSLSDCLDTHKISSEQILKDHDKFTRKNYLQNDKTMNVYSY